MIGGFLAHPAEQYPNVFGNVKFLKNYPYFLPCAIAATFTATIWLVMLVFLQETLQNPIPITEYLGLKRKRRNSNSAQNNRQTRVLQSHIPESDKPLPVRRLLNNNRVVTAAACYA